MDCRPIGEVDIASLVRAARLDIVPERVALLAQTVTGIFQLLDTMDAVDLKEAAPAFAYHAKWEGLL